LKIPCSSEEFPHFSVLQDLTFADRLDWEEIPEIAKEHQLELVIAVTEME